jgi:hypothetical protein
MKIPELLDLKPYAIYIRSEEGEYSQLYFTSNEFIARSYYDDFLRSNFSGDLILTNPEGRILIYDGEEILCK